MSFPLACGDMFRAYIQLSIQTLQPLNIMLDDILLLLLYTKSSIFRNEISPNTPTVIGAHYTENITFMVCDKAVNGFPCGNLCTSVCSAWTQDHFCTLLLFFCSLGQQQSIQLQHKIILSVDIVRFQDEDTNFIPFRYLISMPFLLNSFIFNIYFHGEHFLHMSGDHYL